MCDGIEQLVVVDVQDARKQSLQDAGKQSLYASATPVGDDGDTILTF